MLWKWKLPNGDFQHLPSWRELVVATALSLSVRRHHTDTLIVPMSLIRCGQPARTLMLRPDKLTPAELASKMLARSRPQHHIPAVLGGSEAARDPLPPKRFHLAKGRSTG